MHPAGSRISELLHCSSPHHALCQGWETDSRYSNYPTSVSAKTCIWISVSVFVSNVDSNMDVSVSVLQNRIRIWISEFHADTDVKTDTIRRRYFSLLLCSRTRAGAASLFAVSRANFPPCRHAHANLPIHPALPIHHSVILFSRSKIPHLKPLQLVFICLYISLFLL